MPTESLLINMPLPGPMPAEEHVWRVLAAHLGRAVNFTHPKQPAREYVATPSEAPGRLLRLAYEPGEQQAADLTLCPIQDDRGKRFLWARTSRIDVRAESSGWNVKSDLIAPLRLLLELREEHEVPLRDRYGLVEGKSSRRNAFGALAEPFPESTATFLARLLGLERAGPFPGGKSWAIAVSCDVDVLEDDHIPAVLRFLGEHRVESPTFMICTASPEEKTIRDPSYDFVSGDVRARLAHLREAEVEIGLHGSYVAHDRLEMLVDQKKRLEDWCRRPVAGHRSHFYRFAYPRSWAWQYRAGFSYDASLGYPDLPGFRSGAASPTQFCDPEHGPVAFAACPTGILDQHFFWPNAWPEEQVEQFLSSLVSRLASLGGVLTVDWHSYTSSSSYPGWWARLGHVLDLARARGAYLAGIGKVLSYYARDWLR